MGGQEKFVSALEDHWGAPSRGVTRVCQVKNKEVSHNILVGEGGNEGRKSEGSVREEEEQRMWE